MDIRKEDIKSLEDLLISHKKSLTPKALEKRETQEVVMYAEKAIQTLKEIYKGQFKDINTKMYEKIHYVL